MSEEVLDARPVRPAVAQIAAEPHTTVLIIGGGINGIATFRDLTLQGVDVTLIERDDWVSGASSASSHMIHGGIRYLENGEFRLVRESVHERNGLLKIAPHYVKPLETTVPIFSTFSGMLNAPRRFLTHDTGKPRERGALVIKAGLIMYDTFSRAGGNVPWHRFRTGAKARADMPALNPEIKYTATYFDASSHDPERLALDVLKDALDTGPHARATNYLEAIGVADGGILVADRVSRQQFTIHADVVVNCSGPWTDLTNGALGTTTRYMGGSKGSHIVLDNRELLQATQGRELFFEHNDGRIVLVYPLKGRVLVGTTDIDADPAEPTVCTDAEIDYFIELIGHVFPGIKITPDQIVYSFSGIRPLPRHDDTNPGFVSRDYNVATTVVDGLRATVLSLVGGKWTTFRALGEQLSDKVLALLGRDRLISTTGLAIGGGRGFPTTEATRVAWINDHSGDLGCSRVAQLLERYGTRASEVIEVISSGVDIPLLHSGLSSGEVRYMIDREQAVHIIDLLLRRTDLAFTGAVTATVLEELGEVMGVEIGWDEHTRQQEIAAAVQILRTAHRVDVRVADPVG